jgi:hypothetical protein
VVDGDGLVPLRQPGCASRLGYHDAGELIGRCGPILEPIFRPTRVMECADATPLSEHCRVGRSADSPSLREVCGLILDRGNRPVREERRRRGLHRPDGRALVV